VSTHPIVATDLGRLEGHTKEGVTSFKGVPFAAPPIGCLRWRAPQPAAPWSGIRQAIDYGHDCMQKPFPGDEAPSVASFSEDCLVGNIWVPEQTAGKLPILVWIHGGGWVNGGSSPAIYDGSQFAKHGILVYSFNYRLGRFGFFAHPALSAETEDGLLGNYGFMDQIAAIHWIRKNAEAFGGDPDNVTICGESAGGFAVHILLTSPLAIGLCRRAVVQSGGGRILFNATGLHQGMNGRPSAEQIGVAFAAAKGIRPQDAGALDKLRGLPAEEIVDDLNMATMHCQAPTYSGPMMDGKVVLSEMGDEYLAGRNQKVPMLLGANSVEISVDVANTTAELFARFGANAGAARNAYDPAICDNLAALRQAVGADALMLEPARFLARTVSAQAQPVWLYRFGYVATSRRSQWPEAPHATEIPFVFDTVKVKYGSLVSEEDELMGKQANAYWSNFVKFGNPNESGLPDWPQYESSTDTLMNFTLAGPKAGADPRREQLDLIELSMAAGMS
jgi:para-nitrobenzyl esterase